MNRTLGALLITISASAALAQTKAPLVLRDMGSFHIGGRVAEVSGEPKRSAPLPGGQTQPVDPNGAYLVEQMYVQYFLPQNKRGHVPMLMWHGGGGTGVIYESTPDGREGWLNMFVRDGWDVYDSDAVERGRAGFAQREIFKGEPVFSPLGFEWETYRIGPPGSFNADVAKRMTYPGGQFPVEAYENLVRQTVPRWVTTDEAAIKAYLMEVDKLCPCVLVVHSQSGSFGYRVAVERPDKIKGLVIVEGSIRGDAAAATKVKDIPIMVLYGDNVDKSAMFTAQHQNNEKAAALAQSVGGHIDIVNLPDLGIKGNSHFMMTEKNNAQVAGVIEKWLADKGLVDPIK